MNIIDHLQQIKQLTDQVYEYFGYPGDWVLMTLDDCTQHPWYINGDRVYFQDGDDWFFNYLLNRSTSDVYSGDGFTMIATDTLSDDNKLLQVFDNKRNVVFNEHC